MNSRSFVEGEKILDAGHIIFCGKEEGDGPAVKVVALCLFTSALKGEPHKVTANLIAKDLSLEVCSTTCTCKAGQSECCKYEVGVLLLCNRKGVAYLESVSSTDLECSWKAKGGKRPYDEVVPLQAFCHVKTMGAPFALPGEAAEEIREALIALCPDSALAKHRKRQRVEVLTSLQQDVSPDSSNTTVLANSKKSSILHEVATSNGEPLSTSLAEFYEERLCVSESRAASLMKETLHNRTLWLEQRKVRITGM